MLLTGQILGISGFLSSIIDPTTPANIKKTMLIIGLISAGLLLPFEKSDVLMNGNLFSFSLSGFFVGFGARLANGCTSGHMICGIGRLSRRSIFASLLFFISAVTTSNMFQRINAAAVPIPLNDLYYPKLMIASLIFVVVLIVKVSQHQLLRYAAEYFLGITFGLGLGISGMTSPDTVLRFFTIDSRFWDPSLAFVASSALLVSFLTFNFVVGKVMDSPVVGGDFSLPSNRVIDTKLAIGSILFGMGWGYSGLCPGPALVSLGIDPSLERLIFISTMLIGMRIGSFVEKNKAFNKMAITC